MFETVAARGGPHATSVMGSTYPSGLIDFARFDPKVLSSMPVCPFCMGSGESHGLELEAGLSSLDGIDWSCQGCRGQKQIPRAIFETMIRGIAALSLMENVE